jgi:hypothetical protein
MNGRWFRSASLAGGAVNCASAMVASALMGFFQVWEWHTTFHLFQSVSS